MTTDNKNFHNYEKRMQLLLSRINPDKYGFEESKRGRKRIAFKLTPNNVALLEKYYLDITNEGLTTPRKLALMEQTSRILEWIGKDWEQVSVDDIKALVNKIRTLFSKEKNSDFSEHTKSDYLDKLKRFDKWVNGGDEYTALTKWVKTTMKSRLFKLPNQLLSPEEAKQLIDATKNIRDRAFLATLWETGARVGEVANLKIADLNFNKGECQANLYGKTGSRVALLLESVRDLKNYLQVRNAKSQDEFVFVLLGKNNNGQPITYSAVKRMLEHATQDAGIKKQVHPHLFRHSRASFLASKGMNESVLCSVFGWQIGSKQVRTYIHLSGQQVQSQLKEKVYGIKKPEEHQQEFLACSICGEINESLANECKNCYNPLTVTGALKLKKE
ncbi:MAG: tyrosine-type recombinase/integrase, partial [archaeon]